MPRPAPTDVGAYQPPEAGTAVPLDDVALTPAQQRWVGRHWRLLLTGALALVGGRYTSSLGPLSPTPPPLAVARDTGIVRALTRLTLVICDVVPAERAHARRVPCADLQAGDPYPLFVAPPRDVVTPTYTAADGVGSHGR